MLGAGPAGSVAALMLARAGADALVIDECKNLGFKVGESIPGIVRRLLGSLQLHEILKQLPSIPSSGNRSAWGSSHMEVRQSIFDPYGPGIHLDRMMFDQALLLAAREAGAQLVPGRFIRSEPASVGWRLAVEAHGRNQLVDCKWVMDCTGRRSAFATSLGTKRLTFDKQVAAVAVMARSDRDADRAIVLEAAVNGWWYSTPLPHGRRIVIYFTDGDLIRSSEMQGDQGFRPFAENTSHIRTFVTGAAYVYPPAIMLASTSRLAESAGEHWIAAGDAAATLDPLASMGIRDAILGAMAAVKMILSGESNPRIYVDSIISSHTKHLEMRRAYYQMETRWPDSVFWSRRRAES